MRHELLATGICRLGNKIEFSSVELLQGTGLQAEAETKEDEPQRAVICFGSEENPWIQDILALDKLNNYDQNQISNICSFSI